MVTLSTVAQAAGVSVSVASRVLNGDPNLRARPETRERVLAEAKRLNYAPHFAGRALRVAQAGAIGIIVPDITNAIFAEVVRGVEDAADEQGLIVLLGRTERLQPSSDYLRRLVGERRIDGLLVQRLDEVSQTDFEQVSRANLPTVLLHTRGTRRGSVVVDDVLIGRIATEHLLGLGHTSIGLIGGAPASYTSQQRERGVAAALAEAGLRRRSAWTTRLGYSVQAGYDAFTQLWAESGKRPTAVVVANTNAAVGVLKAAAELGVQVPGQLSVISVHDAWIAEYATPTLTTVATPQYELGLTAVRDLVAQLGGAKAVDTTVTEPDPVVVARASTAPPA